MLQLHMRPNQQCETLCPISAVGRVHVEQREDGLLVEQNTDLQEQRMQGKLLSPTGLDSILDWTGTPLRS